MLPSILPSDRLIVRRVGPDDLSPGAIVTFPDGRGRMVAHRVLRVVGTPPTLVEVRGDSQRRSEWLEPSSLVHVVVSVDGYLGRWTANGFRGRLWRRLALCSTFTPARRLSVSVFRSALRARSWVRRAHPSHHDDSKASMSP